MIDRSAVAALQTENARLTALLEAHGIEWRVPQPTAVEAQGPEPSRLSTAEKVTLFRRLFRGRTDVYPVRWEGKTSGKSGYAPACANEWRAGVCEKPRIKCGDCRNRLLIPLSDAVIYDHLAGEHTVGVYPLLEGDTCYFLAVDFDEADWRDDVRAFMQSCEELGVPAALEISRSGKGGARVGVLRQPRCRPGCPAPGHCHHQPYLRSHPATEAGILRPAVPEPGHDAQGRLRQPDRLAVAEVASREWLQRVRRC
jgi:hypothetical protein